MSEKNKDVKTRAVNETVDAIAGEKASNDKSAVTDAPQHEEHLHMALLGKSASLREVYLKVSDDTGQFFGDMALEDKNQEPIIVLTSSCTNRLSMILLSPQQGQNIIMPWRSTDKDWI